MSSYCQALRRYIIPYDGPSAQELISRGEEIMRTYRHINRGLGQY